jgi:hypothetical protein
MIAEVFGAENIPWPIPLNRSRAANAGYGNSTGNSSRPMNAAATNISPLMENNRAPNRSDRYPDSGPAMRNPTVSGSMKMPAHSGVCSKS